MDISVQVHRENSIAREKAKATRLNNTPATSTQELGGCSVGEVYRSTRYIEARMQLRDKTEVEIFSKIYICIYSQDQIRINSARTHWAPGYVRDRTCHRRYRGILAKLHLLYESRTRVSATGCLGNTRVALSEFYLAIYDPDIRLSQQNFNRWILHFLSEIYLTIRD